MKVEEQKQILEYLVQSDNEKFCRILAEKLINAGVKIELNFKVEAMEEIQKDGIHLGYRPVHWVDDVTGDFEGHDERVKNQLMEELICKIPSVPDGNDNHGVKELYAVHKIISKMED